VKDLDCPFVREFALLKRIKEELLEVYLRLMKEKRKRENKVGERRKKERTRFMK